MGAPVFTVRWRRAGALTVAAALAAALVVAVPPGAHAQTVETATTVLKNQEGVQVGEVAFIQFDPDHTVVVATITGGITPGAFHGFHVHANPVCDPNAPDGPFTTAGGHYNPGNTPHGQHAGDMPVLYVKADGTANLLFVTNRFTVAEVAGKRSVIVHQLPDSYANIPDRYTSGGTPGPDAMTLASGDAGAREACGVIGPATTEEPPTDIPTEDLAPADGAILVDLVNRAGEDAGLVVFEEIPADGDRAASMLVAAFATGIAPTNAFHGFHVHAGDRCIKAKGQPSFGHALGHLNPDDPPNSHPAHDGDMPVLYMAEEDAALAFDTDRVTQLNEVAGHTVIVHQLPDNYANIPNRYQPPEPDAVTRATGDAGGREACGMIEGALRLWGPDRFGTAAAISQNTFPTALPERAEAVVLARAFVYADALTGAPLAEAKGGVTLLTERDQLTDTTETELKRVLPTGKTVFILGGPEAISPAVEQAVRDMGYTTQRLAGATRVETAIRVAEELDATHDRVIVTTGYNWPDAVASGAAAVDSDAVIVYSVGDDPHPATTAYIAAHANEPAFAVGGPAARAYAGLPNENKLFGPTRIETAIAVANRFFPNPTFVALSRDGLSPEPTDPYFADALAGGPHVGRLGGPVVLTDETNLHPAVARYACDNADAIVREYAYGGTAALANEVVAGFENRARGEGC
ncbi:MAG: superoxide dismutase family protein [Actinomycetota bacterium]|nr:superoxide dismutase family protein [Actinomycetota bacterium]